MNLEWKQSFWYVQIPFDQNCQKFMFQHSYLQISGMLQVLKQLIYRLAVPNGKNDFKIFRERKFSFLE